MMKVLSAILVSSLTLVTQSVFAKVLVKYQCPEEFGAKVVLSISSAKPGSFYDSEATLVGPGQDPTTGTFSRSMKTQFEGSTENLNGQTVYHFHNKMNPNHQLFAEIAENGATAELLEVYVREKDQKSRLCQVIVK